MFVGKDVADRLEPGKMAWDGQILSWNSGEDRLEQEITALDGQFLSWNSGEDRLKSEITARDGPQENISVKWDRPGTRFMNADGQ